MSSNSRFAAGWTVDVFATKSGTTRAIYRDCSLELLMKASSLFDRIARTEIVKPRGYGAETRIKYLLPPSVAQGAFLRLIEWLLTINSAAGGDLEAIYDAQIGVEDDDGLVVFLRLWQAVQAFELNPPLDNQYKLYESIKHAIKKGFHTKNNAFKNITITDQEIGLIWDVFEQDRDDGCIRLTLAMMIDAMDVRKEKPNLFKDDIVQRFETLMNKNPEFKSALIHVRTMKNTRLREEAREAKGAPKEGYQRRKAREGAKKNVMFTGLTPAYPTKQKPQKADWEEGWENRELTEDMVSALQNQPVTFYLADTDAGASAECDEEFYEDEEYEEDEE